MRPGWASASPWLLAALLGAAGVAHLLAPRPFETLVPEELPGSQRAWVLGTGVAELVCAATVAVPATRRLGGWASAALLVGVFPGNVQMALDGGARGVDGWLGSAAVAWARLPLQVPLVLWAVGVARRASPGASRDGRAWPGRGRSDRHPETEEPQDDGRRREALRPRRGPERHGHHRGRDVER